MNKGRTGGYLAAAIAVVVLAGLTVVGSVVAKPEKVIVGELEVEYDGGFSPKALPKDKFVPISFFIWSKIRNVNGEHPPALKEFQLLGDKNVKIDVEGVPRCKSGQIQSTTSAAARKACGPALVGSGTTEVEVQFPEQPPVDVKSELLAFNGGFKGGVTTLFIHAYLTAPVTAAIVTTVKIKNVKKGRYGTESIATVPKIAGGSGSVTYFKLKFDKGILFGRCPDGRLQAHGTAVFSDSTKASATVIRPCTTKG
ncbi:MAG TPA: hypothetical protein VLI94_10470 [Solirubrobacterales bacterium]|nr:hypothetical protein [Solirubrobacterales bacterium]